MFKIVNKIHKCDRYNRFKIIINQVRGHCFKYFKEITKQPYIENFFYRKHSPKVTGTLSGGRIILHPYYFNF